MKVVIINKSDSTGGAAVVSMRLLNALRDLGVDARMLVSEKRSDSPYVVTAASNVRIKKAFLAERLKIFLANGMNRESLFKVDTASDGLPLHRHPLVREADVICLNWVNQGMLSIKDLRRLVRLGKPIVWTMHDMWNFTGICHHAGNCSRWLTNCGLCPFLGRNTPPDDLSFSVWNNKNIIYTEARHMSGQAPRLHFVAVSNWLAGLARKSSLLGEASLSVIPNAFPIPADMTPRHDSGDSCFRILMGAARLDDPVKGFPILVEATRVLRDNYPEQAKRIELVTFGNFKNPESARGIAVNHRHLGVISGEMNIRKVYECGDAVISTSLFETLPGTLVEGLVYGCIPISFDRGGQSDIIDHLSTGYIARWDDDLHTAACRIAEGIVWAMSCDRPAMRARMLDSARARFSARSVATAYLNLFAGLGVNA